jgi:S1-C subfamily serine protease
MAVGIIIHISVGKEKRTEYFGEEVIRIGSDENSDLQLHTRKIKEKGLWLELELEDGIYRVINFHENLGISHNGKELKRFQAINDGDVLTIDSADISFSFFSLASESSLITTNREPHIVQFIEEAAVEAASTEKRDDAKAFLREFSRELLREISWTTKLIALVLFVGIFSGIFYLGFGFYQETKKNSELAEIQNQRIKELQNQISKTGIQVGEIKDETKIVRDIFSLAPTLRVDYGNGVCLIVGVYDLVDKKSGKMLRYPDPEALRPDPYEQAPMEEGIYEVPQAQGLTTVGNGDPVEYDFIGTGFHVGDGYIVTNRHVLQPWTEDDLVKQLMKESKGRARIKKLVVYFPNFSKPFSLSVRKVNYREDVAVGTINAGDFLSGIPILPLETIDTDSMAVGKTVVTMGFPNGPDRLMAMLDESEAKIFNQKFGKSRQALIDFLARSQKIVPLTTQGTITDLDKRRVVHDAKTAEGGSGAPLFGQSGKVIGVNFGVFTQNNAANMAVPIQFAISLLEQVGWSESGSGNSEKTQVAQNNSNTSTPPPAPKSQ